MLYPKDLCINGKFAKKGGKAGKRRVVSCCERPSYNTRTKVLVCTRAMSQGEELDG